MAYVGNTPADKTLKLEKQQFTTSATTTYTLSHSVSDPQDIALFINNVRQNPNSSYTVSDTALTLSAATASTDTMYCVFLGRAIGTVGIGAGSVTKDKVDFISDSSGSGVISKGDGSSIDGSIQLNCHVNSHGIKLKSPPHSAGQSYTLTFPSTAPSADKFLKTDGSGNLSFADAGGNTPNFFANKTNDQTISSGSNTKVEFNTEEFDSDSAFASNKFTVPSGKAGKYFFYAIVHLTGSIDQTYNSVELHKNGSVFCRSINRFSSNNSLSESISAAIDLSASDYVEVYVKQNSGSNQTVRGEASERKTYFIGYKLG